LISAPWWLLTLDQRALVVVVMMIRAP